MCRNYDTAPFSANRLLAKIGLRKFPVACKRLCLAWLCCVCFGLPALAQKHAPAQQHVISGKVINFNDDNDDGIPGINVVIKGAVTGTTTDDNGHFTITLPRTFETLVFSGVGYKTVEKLVGVEDSIVVAMHEDKVIIGEVAITGYSIDSRRELAGSVGIVKAEDLAIAPSGNVEQQLQGRVSGVTVITNGQPGTTSQIRIRGFGSFENNDPLYIVDGLPVNTTDFLNPDDIETITVLKDAAAASIYGARASSGVVVYTTKTGDRGAKKISVSYDGMYGFSVPGKGQKMMNPSDYAAWTKKAYENSKTDTPHPQFGKLANWKIPNYILAGEASGVNDNIDLNVQRSRYNTTDFKKPIYQVIAPSREGTDWYKEITGNAPLTRHTLGLSGGGESSRYYVGLSLQDQQGILKNSGLKRYTFRSNTEFSLSKKLRIGENLQLTYREALGLSGDGGGRGIARDENEILAAFRMPTIIPVYDVFGGYAGTRASGFNNPKNPVAARNRLSNNTSFDAIAFGNVYVELEPAEGLVLRSSAGGNYRGSSFRAYEPPTYENSENINAYTYSEGSGYLLDWTVTNTLAYEKLIDDQHDINLLIGQEALGTGIGRKTSANGINPFLTNPNYVTLNTVTNRQVFGEQYGGVSFLSLFGQLRYTLNDKYILTGVIRRDGSSRFSSANRYGVFPALSAAWRISGESFMESFTALTDLKLRAGYGTMGNSNAVDPNNQYTLFAAHVDQSDYDISSKNFSAAEEGYYRSRIGNPDAKWETSITQNIGLDALFFRNKLDITIDAWQRNTQDLLLQLQLPVHEGVQARAPFVNSAQMVNRGLDIQIAAHGKEGAIGYEVAVNGSFLHNEITSIKDNLSYLGTASPNINPNFRGIAPIRNQLGHSVSAFYGYQVTGLFKDDGEAHNSGQDGAGAGRFRFADVSGPEGKPDGKIDVNDRTYLGSPVPKFTGGMNLKLKYKNFEAATYLYTSLGNKIFNQSKWFTDFYPSFSGASISERVKDSWTPDNPNATIPIFEKESNFSTNTQSNSFYVESGDYLRMQNLSLAYLFPASLLTRLKAERLKIFIAANNLFTLTKYSGLDPGVGGNADTAFGIDIGNYPVARSFTAGVSLGF